jgi:hypothetical protein
MKRIIIASLIVVVLGSAAGYGIGYKLGYSKGGKDANASYSSNIEAVNKMFPAPSSTMSLSGTVESISGNAITFDAAPITQNPLADFPKTRQVTITGRTEILKVTFQYETTSVVMAPRTGLFSGPIAGIPEPPKSQESKASLSDIKVGDLIDVTAASDILNATDIIAAKIRVIVVPNLNFTSTSDQNSGPVPATPMGGL